MADITPQELKELEGLVAGRSRWFVISAAQITGFADTTLDWQAIHLDAAAAKKAGFEGPVAHGFLTLSLLSAMYYDALPLIAGATASVNYGFDRLRFVSPVLAGARVRARFVLAQADLSVPDQVTLHHDVTVEIEGRNKPALVARWINREYLEPAK